MKLAGAKQVHYDSGPNMTPLVDVVMVILIFLMLAGSFGTNEHFMASSVPIQAKGGSDKKPPPGWVPPTILDVYVETNGNVRLSGVGGMMQDPEEVRIELAKRLVTYKANNTTDVQVVFHPREGTKWEALAPLYDAALRAKYEKVGFAMAR
jgi:biopolymer transport protein ExbD